MATTSKKAIGTLPAHPLGLTTYLHNLYAHAAASTYQQGPAQAGLSPTSWLAILMGQGNVETGGKFNPTARGKDVGKNGQVSYDNGLAQINSAAHPDVTLAQADNPAFAIPWQAHYLAGLIKQQNGQSYGYDSVRGALAAYNAGSPTSVAGLSYAQEVLNRAQQYGAGGISGPVIDTGTKGPSNSQVTGADLYGMGSGGTSGTAPNEGAAANQAAADQTVKQATGWVAQLEKYLGSIGLVLLFAVLAVVVFVMLVKPQVAGAGKAALRAAVG